MIQWEENRLKNYRQTHSLPNDGNSPTKTATSLKPKIPYSGFIPMGIIFLADLLKKMSTDGAVNTPTILEGYSLLQNKWNQKILRGLRVYFMRLNKTVL